MSESSAFANYSNTSQALKDSVDQSGETTQQITDDKNNFEQQFLIGASLMAKGKATEKLVGLFKKSKKIQSLAGKGNDAIKKLAQSAQDRAEGVAKDLASKIKGVTNPPVSAPTPTGIANPIDLKPLEDARNVAHAERDSTKLAKAASDERVKTATSQLETEVDKGTLARAEAKTALQKAISSGSTGGTEGADATAARKAMMRQGERTQAAQAEKDAALKEQGQLADQLADHEGVASRATADLNNATQSNADQAAEAASAEADRVEATGKEAARLAKLEKDLQRTKDVEEASEATDAADPVGFIVTAVAAAATQFIGRKIKAHENVIEGGVGAGVIPNLTYTSTLGA